MRACSFLSVIVIAPIGATSAFVLPITRRLPPSPQTPTRRRMAFDNNAETIEQLQQEIEAALEEREKLRQELQEEVREFQRQFDEVKSDLQDVDSRLDEQIKTFKQTFDTEKKSLEAKDANIVKRMERLETVKAGGVGAGGLFDGAPLASVAALSVAATGFVARRESILKEKREMARQEAAAKAKRIQPPSPALVTVRLFIICLFFFLMYCHSPNRVSFVQSLVAGVIGMGLIAVSFTGTIDNMNTPFGLTPRKEIFAIRKSETEKLEELLAKLQVEPPEELNADTSSSKEVPVSLDKETETVEMAEKEELAKSETVEPAAKKTETSPPMKVEERSTFTKKANEEEQIPKRPKTEAKTEVDSNMAGLPTRQQDNKPTPQSGEELIATKQDKIDDSNDISSVIENKPPVQGKAAAESTKPAPMQAEESKEPNKLMQVPNSAIVEKDEKTTSLKDEPTISKNQEEKPLKETTDVSSSTPKLEAKQLNQKENAESPALSSNENTLSSGIEKSTIAAKTSESSASKVKSDALDNVAQKNGETPSDEAKATTSVAAPIMPSSPVAGSVSKAASGATNSVSKASENVQVPESPSGGAASASKAIESLSIPDPSSIKNSVSKVFDQQKVPSASDPWDVVVKTFANFKFPDTSGLVDNASKLLEELPRNPAALAAIGTVLSATIISKVLEMMKGSSNPDSKSENTSSAAPNGATTLDDRAAAIPKSPVSEGRGPLKKSLTPLEKRFSSEPLPKNGSKSPTGKDSRSIAKQRHSASRHSNKSPSTKSSPNGSGDRTTNSSTTKSMTPLEKKFGAAATSKNGSERPEAQQRQRHEQTKERSAPRPISNTPNGSGDRTTSSSTTKSMTPLEKKFGSAATSKNGPERSEAQQRPSRGQAKTKSSPFPNSVTSPGPTNSKTPLEKKFGVQDVARNNSSRNGSTYSTSSNGSVNSKTPLERKFERDAAKTSNGATTPDTESVKTNANPKSDIADRGVKAKRMSEGPGKPPLKGKATITQSKRKYIMDAEFEPVSSNGSNKSDTTSSKSSPALSKTPIVLDAVMDNVKGYANKVPGKKTDSAYSSGSPVVLDDSLMDSIKEYVKQQAGSSTSPAAVDALMESVKEYVQKQAGSKAPIVLDDALMESIKEYVNKQAGSISGSSTSTK